ncbi:hypothetical protein CJF39_09585 [Pseudomonas lundensis]|uniref:Type I restriction modification DNA specificity domain-containing protein n=1 Tax=Pseudomonas lundensis TaxID=86185 RepID=A0A266NBB5_9PSED|nr:restriction endonuclease subunit S [Pseudomonas lundensis]OZY59786.1 hypothetical protein CJF39_09585 [Pseudomonas lundensis]
MSDLPNGWRLVSLGEIGYVQSGIGFPIEYQGLASGDYPVYKVGDVSRGVTQDNGKLQWATNYIAADTAKILKGQIFEVGSTLFAKIGEALKLNRRGFVVTAGLADNNVMGYKAEKSINDRFIYYFLCTQDFAEYSRSTTVPSIRKGDIEEIQVALPPNLEQILIAQKLDDLLAQVNTLTARIDAILPLLKRFRQSVLAAAVSGRLTEEFRACTPTQQPRPLPTKYSLPQEELAAFAIDQKMPQGWVCVSAADVCSSVRDGTHDTPNYHQVGIPLVTSKNIGNGYVDISGAKLISQIDHLEISKRSLVEPGDVLFSMIGTVGNCCVVRKEDGEFSIKNVGLFKNNETTILPKFLECWLKSKIMWAWLDDHLKGSSQKFASLGTLRALPVFLPKLEEQTEIVGRIEQLFAFADQLEAKVASAKSRIDHLTQSILAKAFRGELVPQDPDDEPASVLLERIKARRATAPKAKRGRKTSA